MSFKFFLQLDCCAKSKSVELNQNANNHVLLNQNIYNSEGFFKIKLRDLTFIYSLLSISLAAQNDF